MILIHKCQGATGIDNRNTATKEPLLGTRGRELRHGLSAFRDSMLGELSREDEADGGLDFS